MEPKFKKFLLNRLLQKFGLTSISEEELKKQISKDEQVELLKEKFIQFQLNNTLISKWTKEQELKEKRYIENWINGTCIVIFVISSIIFYAWICSL